MKLNKKFPRDLTVLTHEYPPFPGGIATYCSEIVKALSNMGVRITVWAPTFGEEKAFNNGSSAKVVSFKGRVFKKSGFIKVLFLALKAIKATPKGGGILAADWPFVAACGLLRRFLPFSYSVMLHGSEILFFRRSKVVHLLLGGDPFFKADKIFVNSAYTGSVLKANYPHISDDRVVITHLGVNSFWLETSENKISILDKLDIAKNKKIVLSTGRIVPRKGQMRCINALQELPKSLKKDIVYVIVGKTIDHAYDAEIRERASQVDYPVIFAGTVTNEELRDLYRSSEVFCLPSQNNGTKIEGFGLVFLEAAGSALPSVAVAEAAVPEVVENGESGILVGPDNQKALTEALKSVLENDTLSIKLGNAAQERATTFTWDNCALAMIKSFGDLENKHTTWSPKKSA
ncbi:MAG: glycosyltransferase family 1 protein [Alphaproteobacteria bacterium]|nr:MAG: glycosyltransferase family 1 protein [Alphaproteobacteria bacterium]